MGDQIKIVQLRDGGAARLQAAFYAALHPHVGRVLDRHRLSAITDSLIGALNYAIDFGDIEAMPLFMVFAVNQTVEVVGRPQTLGEAQELWLALAERYPDEVDQVVILRSLQDQEPIFKDPACLPRWR